ncbi:MAG: cation:proton antiporter [Thermoleophilia bacterium]|nr:cation:proton antiporter [Thermoleophilia bacterium]
MELWQLLMDVVVLLGACLLAGGIFSRLGQRPLVGFLLAGMLLGGPGSLHLIGSKQEIEIIAELGVALLLFGIGLEFSWRRVRSLGGRVLAGGAAQVLATLLLCAAAALALELVGPAEAVAVGAMVALSSTAVVLRVLVDRAEIDSAHGRATLAVLLVQDLAVVPLALLLTVMGEPSSPREVALEVGRVLLAAGGLIVVLYLVLNQIAVRALGRLTVERNRELTVLMAVVTGLGSAWAAHQAGISPALGAFVAGMFLGNSPFATQVRADVASLRVVLLTMFFGAAGMVADPVWIFLNAHRVLGLALALLIGKALIVWLVLLVARQPHSVALAAGLCLAQIGEFAFVLGTIGRDSGLVAESTYQLIVSTAIVLLIATPYVIPAAPWIAARLAFPLRRGRAGQLGGTAVSGGSAVDAPDVLIVGFGPAGQIAAQKLIGTEQRVHVLDLNREGSRKAIECGFDASIGDATQREVLEHVGVKSAHTVVITLPDRRTALAVLDLARRLAPTARVLVRARYHIHVHEFEAAGAHVVVGDEDQVGKALADRLGLSAAVSDT